MYVVGSPYHKIHSIRGESKTYILLLIEPQGRKFNATINTTNMGASSKIWRNAVSKLVYAGSLSDDEIAHTIQIEYVF